MENQVVVIEPSKNHVPVQRREFFDSAPKDQVTQASEIATVLKDVIEKQGLFSLISGKKYIKAEGWQTLGTFLGVTAREKSVVKHEDGSFEAYVELLRFRDGTVVGGASAICTRKERRWEKADDYAVRSMAVTRATGKAFRLSFAWIVTLAGYAPTNEEEMPEYTKQTSEPMQSQAQPKPQQQAQKSSGYEPQNKAHQDVLVKVLQSQKIPDTLWDDIGNAMAGKPFSELSLVVESVREAKAKSAEVLF
jgi:hypothetical protein